MSKSNKLYSDSPSLKRGEDGEVGVQKPSEADADNMGVGGSDEQGDPAQMPIDTHQEGERREMKHRHVGEHLAQHHRHETEHSTHKGDKAELYKKHEAEMADMHKRHQEEMASMHKRHGAGAKTEKKVEKTAPKSASSDAPSKE